MKNVVLVHVSSPQVKKDLFEVLNDYGFEIIVANNVNEIREKYALHTEELTLYIQEFDEKNKIEAFGRLKIIDSKKLNSILLIHSLDVDIIEEASSLSVKDVVKLPFTFEGFRRRIRPLVMTEPVVREKLVKVVEEKPDEKKPEFDFSVLKDEMSRSVRGHYPVMAVVVVHSDELDNSKSEFLDILKAHLRTTDRVEIYNKSTLLIHCPFTPKVNFEIVQNKIDEAFLAYDENYSSKNHISGLAFPDDTDDMEDAIEKIKNQIEDNMLFFQIDNPKNNIDLQALRSKLRRNFL